MRELGSLTGILMSLQLYAMLRVRQIGRIGSYLQVWKGCAQILAWIRQIERWVLPIIFITLARYFPLLILREFDWEMREWKSFRVIHQA